MSRRARCAALSFALATMLACGGAEDARPEPRAPSAAAESDSASEIARAEERTPEAPEPPADAPAPTRERIPAPRRAFAGTLARLWESEPSDYDSLLIHPVDVLFSRYGLLVLDIGDRQIRVFDGATGKHRRTVGREGGGPGEFTIPLSLLGSYDRPLAFDTRQRRLTVLFDSGGEPYTLPFPKDRRWLSTCALDTVRTFGIIASDPGPDYFVVEGERFADSTFAPWERLRGEHFMARQGSIRQLDDSTCAVLPVYQPEFAVYARGQYVLGRTVEDLPPAQVEVTESADGKSRRASFTTATAGSSDAHAWRDQVIVLFAGKTKQRNRLLDFYRRTDLAYTGSIALPFETHRFAVRGDTIAVAGVRDDYPAVAVFLIRATRLR